MGRTKTWWMLVMLGVGFACACGSEERGSASTVGGSAGAGGGSPGTGGATGGTAGDAGSGGNTQPPDVKASGCDIPPLIDLGELVVRAVGDGTPGSCDVSSLQEALDAGGKIRFDCGSEPLTLHVSETLVVKDGTHIEGAGRVTLDGEGIVRILRTENNSSVIVEGLTFVNGRAIKKDGEDEADGSGGAIRRGWRSNLYVKDCVFRNNLADGDDGFNGGAIFAGSAGWLTIVGSTFADNRAPSGGATHTVLSDLTVVDSVFHQNEATNGDGGAVYTDGAYVPYQGELGVNDGKITLCGCRFTDNVATSSAAAGFLYAYGQDRLVINRTEFRGNRVTTSDPGLGGAIRIDAVAFVSNSLFAENACAGQGGAVWMGRGPATFENVTFHANEASKWGGAISYHTQAITLRNCTLAFNVAGEGSDCLFGAEEPSPLVHNVIFHENGDGGTNRHCRRPIQATNVLVHPAEDNDTCGAGLIHDDPLLASELADHGGFTMTLALGAGSPALGAGTDCPTTDQRGEPRDKDGCDLGAFEASP